MRERTSTEGTVSVEVSGVEPFKRLVEACVVYRSMFPNAHRDLLDNPRSVARTAMFAALEALNDEERLWRNTPSELADSCPSCGSVRARVMHTGCHVGTKPDRWHRAAMLREEAAEWDAEADAADDEPPCEDCLANDGAICPDCYGREKARESRNDG